MGCDAVWLSERDRLLGLLDPKVRTMIFRREIPNDNAALPRTPNPTSTSWFISKYDCAHVCYTSTNIYQTCQGVRNVMLCVPTDSFLGAFAVLLKATFSFMSVRLSDRMDQLESHWTGRFSWIFKLVAFINMSWKFKFITIRHKYWALCMQTYARFITTTATHATQNTKPNALLFHGNTSVCLPFLFLNHVICRIRPMWPRILVTQPVLEAVRWVGWSTQIMKLCGEFFLRWYTRYHCSARE